MTKQALKLLSLFNFLFACNFYSQSFNNTIPPAELAEEKEKSKRIDSSLKSSNICYSEIIQKIRTLLDRTKRVCEHFNSITSFKIEQGNLVFGCKYYNADGSKFEMSHSQSIPITAIDLKYSKLVWDSKQNQGNIKIITTFISGSVQLYNVCTRD